MKRRPLFAGKCKPKELKLTIALLWHGIGDVWRLDITDTELISKN